jgi:lactoylglutathione lyase
MPRVMGVGVNVPDLARSVEFYERVLGMREIARYDTAVHLEAVMTYGDDMSAPSLLLIQPKDHDPPYEIGDGLAKILLVVDDLRAVHDRMVARGCRIEREPTEYPQHGQMVAIAFDPDGYRLELLQPL